MAKNIEYPVKKLVGLTRDQAERIADFRFGMRIGSENEAIRRLLELGLKAVAEGKSQDEPDVRR